MNLRAEGERIMRGWERERETLLRQAERTTDEFTREMYEAEAARLTRTIQWWENFYAR